MFDVSGTLSFFFKRMDSIPPTSDSELSMEMRRQHASVGGAVGYPREAPAVQPRGGGVAGAVPRDSGAVGAELLRRRRHSNLSVRTVYVGKRSGAGVAACGISTTNASAMYARIRRLPRLRFQISP